MTSFTPGKWEAWKTASGKWTVRSVYYDEYGRCTTWPAVCDAGAQDNEANAHLISAAPDLLEALKQALLLVNEQHSDWRSKAEAAIAKAENSKTFTV